MSSLSLPRDEHAGRTGELSLRFSLSHTQTVLEHARHYGLLRASRPVYRKPSVPEVQIVHLGPGSMDKDRYSQEIFMDEGTEAKVGYQSFTKVLPGTYGAQHEMSITVRAKSSLLLEPNIIVPYSSSTYVSRSTIYLDSTARVFVPEILLLGNKKDSSTNGRVHFSRLYSSVHVYLEDQLKLRDCIDLGRDTLTRGQLWTRDFPVVGTLLVLGAYGNTAEESLYRLCLGLDTQVVQAGVTLINELGFAFRIMGRSVDVVRNVIEEIRICLDGFVGHHC